MAAFVGIETFAGNALAELAKKQIREISFEKLVCYARAVAREYRRRNGEEIVLLMSTGDQLRMLDDFPGFFEVDWSHNGIRNIRLKDAVPLSDLEDSFRWTLSPALYGAMTSPEAQQRLRIG